MERDVAAMLASGMDALERQDLPAAEQCFRRVLGRQPANHGAWNALAWTYLRSGEAQLALEHAQRAHHLSRRNVEYLNTLGVAHAESGSLGEAEPLARLKGDLSR